MKKILSVMLISAVCSCCPVKHGRDAGHVRVLSVAPYQVTGNRYRGQLEGTDGSPIIGFKQMISTRRYGPHQAQEDLLFKVQEKVDGFYRYGQSLLLLADQKVVVEARVLE